MSASARPGVPLGIEVRLSGMRSTNIERDLSTLDPDHLRVNNRAQDVLERLTSAINNPSRSRAWSLTGPYGSGKSTVALLIGWLLGRSGERREHAEEALRESDRDLANRLKGALGGLTPDGFIIAGTTARKESITATLGRALLSGADRHWDGRPPRRVANITAVLASGDATHAQFIEAVKVLCGEAPLLLLIDEFGKNLEYFAAESERVRDDIYLLQELAELGAGKAGLPLFIMTLQHLSFGDYAAGSTALQRREWAKIQGRFEDVAFGLDLAESLRFISDVIHQEQVGADGQQLIRSHAELAAAVWSGLDLDRTLLGNPETFAALYPLHPLTAIAAPMVAAQVGQHDRSLAGFLTGDEPFTVRRFIQDQGSEQPAQVATVRLAQLYDYFFASGRSTIMASANASRWIEIDQIINEAHGRDTEELEILKTVGILNLIDAGGSLRASESMICFALNDPAVTPERISRDTLAERLKYFENTEGGGVGSPLVYRKFSDEYRIWRGTDVEINAQLSEIRDKLDDRTVVKALRTSLPPAAVAGRHSQKTGFLRHFPTDVSSTDTGYVQGPEAGGAADGLLIFHFGDREDIPQINSELPVVVGISKEARRVLDIGRELIAHEELAATVGEEEWVARRELLERAGQIRVELAATITKAFKPGSEGATWFLTGCNARTVAPLQGVRSLAGVVSQACDAAFPDTPHIRNEMLGRHQLTSQGAKARRELISAMVTSSARERLGIGGYGPEVAIYEGVLRYMGLHRPVTAPISLDDGDQKFELAEPAPGTPLHPAWLALRAGFTAATEERPVAEIFGLLAAPPYGVKAGAVPVILTAALLIFRESVAVFEEGTYQPSLTPELMERLIKAPERYTVKYISASEGARRRVLAEVIARMGIRARSASSGSSLLLTVTRNILNELRMLSAYAKRTKRLSRPALAVRQAITEARDPDDFIFAALPRALGLAPFKVGDEDDPGRAAEYADKLFGALDECRSADRELRKSVISILAREFRTSPGLPALRRDLAIRVAPFADVVQEAEMSGFIKLALNEAMTDEDWLDPIVVRLVRAGLPSWNDDHVRQFELAARRVSAGLDRLASLHVPDPAQPDKSRDLQLVTYTSPSGHANSVLVHIPEKIRADAHRLAVSVLADAEAKLGIDGRRVLLAALAALVTSPGTEDTDEASDQAPQLFSQKES